MKEVIYLFSILQTHRTVFRNSWKALSVVFQTDSCGLKYEIIHFNHGGVRCISTFCLQTWVDTSGRMSRDPLALLVRHCRIFLWATSFLLPPACPSLVLRPARPSRGPWDTNAAADTLIMGLFDYRRSRRSRSMITRPRSCGWLLTSQAKNYSQLVSAGVLKPLTPPLPPTSHHFCTKTTWVTWSTFIDIEKGIYFYY